MLWAGTYQAKGGAGLFPVRLSEESIGLGEPEANIANASFGVWCQRRRTAYFVDEQEAGRITAWSRADGQWHDRGASGSGGALPCFVALDPARRFLAAANYGDGSLALVGLDAESGRIRELADVVHHSGRGPNEERQSSPHVHCALFDEAGAAVYAVDLGLDRVFRYRVENGRLKEAEVMFEAPPGSGPRHLLLHPDRRHALLLTELSAELMLLERHPDGFRLIERVAAAPEHGRAKNLGGHLALASPGRVLVSNRGYDSIVAFDLAGDRLSMSASRMTHGASPRYFLPAGRGLIVAHEESEDLEAVPLPGAASAMGQKVALPGAAFVIEIPD